MREKEIYDGNESAKTRLMELLNIFPVKSLKFFFDVKVNLQRQYEC